MTGACYVKTPMDDFSGEMVYVKSSLTFQWMHCIKTRDLAGKSIACYFLHLKSRVQPF